MGFKKCFIAKFKVWSSQRVLKREIDQPVGTLQTLIDVMCTCGYQGTDTTVGDDLKERKTLLNLPYAKIYIRYILTLSCLSGVGEEAYMQEIMSSLSSIIGFGNLTFDHRGENHLGGGLLFDKAASVQN